MGLVKVKVFYPAQAQAENEFLAAAIAKEQALYAGNAEYLMAYYADNAISVQPGVPEDGQDGAGPGHDTLYHR